MIQSHVFDDSAPNLISPAEEVDDDARAAIAAAQALLLKFTEAAAIDTANARECAFILEAARIAIADPEFAGRIGALMRRYSLSAT